VTIDSAQVQLVANVLLDIVDAWGDDSVSSHLKLLSEVPVALTVAADGALYAEVAPSAPVTGHPVPRIACVMSVPATPRAATIGAVIKNCFRFCLESARR
jgi:hypothetical protein